MTYSDPLHNLIDQYLHAERAVNTNHDDSRTDDLNAAHIAALNKIKETDAVASSAAGAIAAISLAAADVLHTQDFEFIRPLLIGGSAYMLNGGEAMESAMSMAAGFNVNSVTEHGWMAIYDALSACITAVEGVSCQPQCSDQHSYNAAGAYLCALVEFLMSERRRVMRAAEKAVPRETTYRGDLLQLIIRHHMDEMDLRKEDIAALEAVLTLAKAREKDRGRKHA
ncbi:hypothetical protein [Rhizobium rhizogenes]|uniref:hypothetical protein n=1 Tax=Rhizobium rhizogenes TaxID=359 RepID=UPI001572FCE3|nr:hypothetical protein [Rhizobium rhizogenes]NTF43091.1 hypothetical protein [Rhizobium rhizogenes]